MVYNLNGRKERVDKKLIAQWEGPGLVQKYS